MAAGVLLRLAPMALLVALTQWQGTLAQMGWKEGVATDPPAVRRCAVSSCGQGSDCWRP